MNYIIFILLLSAVFQESHSLGTTTCAASSTALQQLDAVITGPNCAQITSAVNCQCTTVPTIISSIVNATDSTVNACVGNNCAQIQAVLQCIVTYAQSVATFCGQTQYICIQYILQLLGQQIRAKVTPYLTNADYSSCKSQLNNLLQQLDTAVANCISITRPPVPKCNASTGIAIPVACLDLPTTVGSVGSTVLSLLRQLDGQSLLGGVLGIVCTLLNPLLFNKVGNTITQIITQLNGILTPQLPSPTTPANCSCAVPSTGSFTDSCNSLVATLLCLTVYIQQYANSPQGNPCSCGILQLLVNALLQLVNTLLGQLLGTTGDSAAIAECRKQLENIYLTLKLITCCNTTCTLNILGLCL